MIKLSQYHIFKISTSRLSEFNDNIPSLTIAQARLNGELVQLGDNQVFRMIRAIRNITTDIEKLDTIIKERDGIKALPSSDENSIKIAEKQQQIDDILHVPDIINIKVDDRKSYKRIFKNGVCVNGKRYLRLCSGSGQSRRSTVTFVNSEIKEELERKLNCGLSIKKINVAKYNAYFGLYMSSTYQVRTPRVCLIDDCEVYKLKKTVDWIEDINKDNKFIGRKVVEKEIDIYPNMWDGQGLISPAMATQWKDDLELDYLPSQFGIRSAFIKGMLVTFDIHKFAKEIAQTDKITDFYGKTWDIQDIDVILSVSQFKMAKLYQSWDQYVQLHKHHGHSWGVTKVNPKYDNNMSLLNYQYIQTLNLDRNKISTLIKPTVDWIEKICNGDKLYTLLFLLGSCKESDTIDKIFDKTNNNYIKAVLYNDSLLKDPYIKKKIYDSISTKIQEAKIGRVWVGGNYQAMISCPYGQAQWAFKMDNVTGLLNEHQHYSHFWNTRNVLKVDACRSPMVDFSEHNILNFVNNEKTREWYSYIRSGIVYNTWGVDTIRHSDSDWDYDIVFTTDNKIMLNNIFPNKNVITYEKTSAPSQTLSHPNILKTDLRSFDCKVGTITNYSTAFISMLANFKNGSTEYNELIDRIKLLRRYIGDSIDQAKGVKMKSFPTDWKSREYIRDTDTEEEKMKKHYHNSLVANKKPYFMIYVYDRVLNEYREYRKKCERTCREKFGCSLGDLLKKKNKSKSESYYVSDFYRRMPVLKNDSAMNMLCGMIEEIDFNLKRPKNDENAELVFKVLFDETLKFEKETLDKLVNLHDKFKKKRHFKHRNSILSYIDFDTEEDNAHKDKLNAFYSEIRNEAYSICSNEMELANYLIYIAYRLFPNEGKEFAWSIGIAGILSILQNKSDKKVEIPVPDCSGTGYLGGNYSLGSVVI